LWQAKQFEELAGSLGSSILALGFNDKTEELA